MLAEERCHLANAVRPRIGIPAGRSAAPARRVCIDTCRNVAHGIIAVEGVVCPRIDLDRHRMTGFLGRFG